MSINTNFLLSNGTDLGNTFVQSNSSANGTFTFITPIVVGGQFINSNNSITFNTTGKYLITLSCAVQNTGNSNTDAYTIVLSNGEIPSLNISNSISGTTTAPYNNILLATPRYYANSNNLYNYMPSTMSGIINVTTASTCTFYVYGFNNPDDNNYPVYVTGSYFFIG